MRSPFNLKKVAMAIAILNLCVGIFTMHAEYIPEGIDNPRSGKDVPGGRRPKLPCKNVIIVEWIGNGIYVDLNDMGESANISIFSMDESTYSIDGYVTVENPYFEIELNQGEYSIVAKSNTGNVFSGSFMVN